MAKQKIVWSHRSGIKLLMILEFYSGRNKSKTYSKKLYTKFNKEFSLLVNQPEIDIKTELESVRGLIVEEFILFYEVTTEMIIVHTLWDSRQTPSELRIKLSQQLKPIDRALCSVLSCNSFTEFVNTEIMVCF